MNYLFDPVIDLPPLEVRYLDIPLASFFALQRLVFAAPIRPTEHSLANARHTYNPADHDQR
jgi:hypothetical protein